MGSCTTLHIDSKHSIADITKVIERCFETKITVEHTHDANFVQLFFELQGDQKRLLSLFTSYQTNGFTGTYLSLGASGRASDVMRAIAEVFGGYMREDDGMDQFIGYNGLLNEGDGLPFWVRFAIVSGIDHRNVDALGAFIAQTKAKWQK